MSDHDHDDTLYGDWPDDEPRDLTYDDLVRHTMHMQCLAMDVLAEHAKRPPVQVPDYSRRDRGSDGSAVAQALTGALPHLLELLSVLRSPPRPETPPGMTMVDERRLEDLLNECDVAKTRAEAAEETVQAFTDLLARVSVMLGYGGDVDHDFQRMLKARPGPGAPPVAYLLPDGSHTNVVNEALVAWQDVSPSAVKKAKERATNRATGNAPEPDKPA